MENTFRILTLAYMSSVEQDMLVLFQTIVRSIHGLGCVLIQSKGKTGAAYLVPVEVSEAGQVHMTVLENMMVEI